MGGGGEIIPRAQENFFFFLIIILLKVLTISYRTNTNIARGVCWTGKTLLLRRRVP